MNFRSFSLYRDYWVRLLGNELLACTCSFSGGGGEAILYEPQLSGAYRG